MYCNGSSGMATLLQQKNYKTLSNNGGNAANNVVIDGTSSMANGHSSLDGMAASSKGKMLMPHELVTVPTTTNVSANYTSNPFNGYQHQQQHNSLHQHPHQMNQRLTSTSIHHNPTTNNHLANHSYTTTTTASSTSSAIHHQFYQSGSLSQLSSEQQQQLLDDCIEEDDGGDGEDDTANSGPATDNKHEQSTGAVEPQDLEPEPEIDIVINNVVCSFSVRCHLNLRQIALNGFNVEFRRENGMVTMKLRRPYTTASIWSSGRITCTGATSEDQAKVAARRYARCLQKLGFNARLHNFRVVNVLGTCSMPWAIKITNFSEKHRQNASYEPELHPGVTYKLKSPKATLKIFSTGSITVTAPSVSHVQQAIEHIFPLVYEFRKKRTAAEEEKRAKHLEQYSIKRPLGKAANDFDDVMGVSDADEHFEEFEEEEDEEF